MATFTPSWTIGTTLHASTTVTNGSTAQDDVNLSTLGYYRINGTIDIDIASGSPAGNVTVELFGSADGGTNIETVARQTFAIPFSATGNKKAGFVFDGNWVRVKITNSTGVTVTYVSKYSGLKQASA